MSHRDAIQNLNQHVSDTILGQQRLVSRLLIALLADGHLLVEGAPGLAKTTAIKTLASGMEADFHRIQFTPDLLPADLTGTEIFRPQDGSFHFQNGPIFHNLILADEINRSPAKVQSALLEAMGERQVTVGKQTYPLPELFMVMATQNPIEQEGTYPLPEAQLDRFLMHVHIGYPDQNCEQAILQLARDTAMGNTPKRFSPDTKVTQKSILEARKEILDLHMSEALEEYLIQIILASRSPDKFSPTLARWIRFGSSPRGTIALDRCARAYAWLEGREFVTPDDIQSVAWDVLRHRILLSFEAEAEGITPDMVINELIQQVAVP